MDRYDKDDKVWIFNVKRWTADSDAVTVPKSTAPSDGRPVSDPSATSGEREVVPTRSASSPSSTFNAVRVLSVARSS
jgi:hypothetical protein